MQTILITGGAGFVGSNLAVSFRRKYPDYKIIAFDNLHRRGSELNVSRLKEFNIDFIHGDIRNKEDFCEIKKVDTIVDASAEPSVLSGINTSIFPLINTNLMGTVNVLELARELNSNFIFLSTSRIYPINSLEDLKFEETETRFQWTDEQIKKGASSKGITEEFDLTGGRSFYGATKLASELLINEYFENVNMKTVINRCGVISGPWQMGKVDQGVLVLWLARHIYKKEIMYLGYGGQGKQMRDVLHVADLFDLIDLQVHNMDKFNGQTFNVGGGLENSFSLLELTKLCEEVTENKVESFAIKENRKADIRIYVTDNKKITDLCGWKPRKNVKETIKDTYEWIKKNDSILRKILN